MQRFRCLATIATLLSLFASLTVAAPAAPAAAAPSDAAPSAAAKVGSISAGQLLDQAAAHRQTPVILDVRTPAEFAAGHIPGAVNVPHDQVGARLDELAGARDREVVVYCRSGKRAALALDVLGQHGFKHLAHLQGDMPGWEAAGHAVETAAPAAGAH